MNHPSNFPSQTSQRRHSPAHAADRLPKIRGMTLVELMVAAMLFAFVTVGLLATVIQSYRLAAEVRVRNEVRYVLRSMADQFSRTTFTSTNPLFTISAVPTGTGLSWRKDTNVFSLKPSGATATDYIDGTAAGLVVPIAGSTGTPVNVTFTCWIRGVNPSTGAATITAPAATAGGYLLRGDFTASFTIAGRPLTQTMSILRAVP